MVRDQLFTIVCNSIDPRFGDLEDDSLAASWLKSDIQYDRDEIVELVDRIARFSQGLETGIWEQAGNAWDAVLDDKGISLECMYNEEIGVRRLSHADILSIISQFWRCLLELGSVARFEKSVAAFVKVHRRSPSIPWPLDNPVCRF